MTLVAVQMTLVAVQMTQAAVLMTRALVSMIQPRVHRLIPELLVNRPPNWQVKRVVAVAVPVPVFRIQPVGWWSCCLDYVDAAEPVGKPTSTVGGLVGVTKVPVQYQTVYGAWDVFSQCFFCQFRVTL